MLLSAGCERDCEPIKVQWIPVRPRPSGSVPMPSVPVLSCVCSRRDARADALRRRPWRWALRREVLSPDVMWPQPHWLPAEPLAPPAIAAVVTRADRPACLSVRASALAGGGASWHVLRRPPELAASEGHDGWGAASYTMS